MRSRTILALRFGGLARASYRMVVPQWISMPTCGTSPNMLVKLYLSSFGSVKMSGEDGHTRGQIGSHITHSWRINPTLRYPILKNLEHIIEYFHRGPNSDTTTSQTTRIPTIMHQYSYHTLPDSIFGPATRHPRRHLFDLRRCDPAIVLAFVVLLQVAGLLLGLWYIATSYWAGSIGL
jgi:hypothetical protein